MKKLSALLLIVFLLFTSCKKDAVDATNIKTFQSSINDMASSLPTLQQIKFNEALYILKTFGVEADGDENELARLSKLINGKKVPEIFALADQVAQKNAIAWSSTGPPSLGDMNIFGNLEAKEKDPNEITANSLSIITRNISVDSILGPKALQIIPKLMDNSGNPIVFEGAALETTMEVLSNGLKLTSSKNLMQNNNFSGFTIRYANLPADKITDNKIDVTVTVKTTAKTFKMTKIGIPINAKALQKPLEIVEPNPENSDSENPNITDANGANSASPTDIKKTTDPKTTVQRFLNNLSSQNLRGAYDASENPNWGSYEKFSNPTSGFGTMKSLNVKNISSGTVTDNTASVNASYDVTDKDGKTATLKVTFGLKNVNGDWKIASYRIN